MSSNDSTAKEQSFLFNVNKIFLVIHLLMLFMFSSLGVDLMAGVSLISICFYFLAFSLTKIKWGRITRNGLILLTNSFMSENAPVRIRLYAETYFKALTFLNEL